MTSRAAAVALVLAATAAAWNGSSSPSSFYVVRHHFSDAMSPYNVFARILEVVSQKDSVRLRLIALSGIDWNCDATVVSAAERTVPKTTIAAIAGEELCAIGDNRVRFALARAKKRGIIVFEGETSTYVATCGRREQTFTLPVAETVNWHSIGTPDRDIAAVGDLFERIVTRFDLEERPDDDDAARGAMADLRAGRFQTGLGRPMPGPFFREVPAEPPSELLEQATLPLETYTPALLPKLARVARASGDVRLRLTVDRQTGAVTGAAAISGDPLLVQSAVDAARTWRFTPGALAGDHVEATLRFTISCP